MTTRPKLLVASTALLVTFTLATNLHAAPVIRYTSAPDGQALQVDGSSNIHDWSAKTDRISGWIELPGQWRQTGDGVQLDAAPELADASHLEVQIPVRTLKSGKSGLDDNMYKALEAKEHPQVSFVLTRVDARQPAETGSSVVWEATGDLTVAGKTRSVALDLTIEPISGDRLKITARKPLKMSDFKIDPPTAMFGMARAADDVTVEATWVVERRTPQPIVPPAQAPATYRQGSWQVLEAYARAGRALAENAWPEAQQALADVARHGAALAELNSGELPGSLREPWKAAATRLQAAAANAGAARTLGSAQASFAVLTQALMETIALVGFEHDAPITAYRHADQRGVAGSVWLHVPMIDAEGKPWPVRSPYGSAGTPPAEPVALYMPGPVTIDQPQAQP